MYKCDGAKPLDSIMNDPNQTPIAPMPPVSDSSAALTGNAAWKPLVAHLCALVVAGFFLYYSYGKVKDPRQFAIDIGNYQLLSKYAAACFAIVLPWWEIGAALALLLPRTRPAGAILIGGMLIMFIAAVSLAMSKGLDITCGCGGTGSGKAGWNVIYRNSGLLVGTFLSVYLMPRRMAAR